jgi:hypothetical protein
MADDDNQGYNGNDNQGYNGNDDGSSSSAKTCMIYDRNDFFTVLVQIMLAFFALACLYIKRLQETPRRNFRTWFLDISKQAFGACYAHILNMVRSCTPSFLRLSTLAGTDRIQYCNALICMFGKRPSHLFTHLDNLRHLFHILDHCILHYPTHSW